MNYFKNKNILITGGTGLIGRKLIKLLSDVDCKIRLVSLDDYKDEHSNQISFVKADLRNYENCLECSKDIDIVIHLAGVKGSPKMCIENPASFLTPTVMFSFNMLEAARKNKVKDYLFTSSVGVYSPSEVFYEDSVWSTFPSKNDWFAGWAKRVCELQIEAYKKQYNWKKLYIVRPANVYGPFDNFGNESSMVIPSMIKKFISAKDNIVNLWGDGSPIRDFIFSEDVARCMLRVIEKNYDKPINAGSGFGCSIKELAKIIKDKIDKNIEINWDKSKPNGDKIRLMDTKSYKKIDFKNKFDLENGISETIDWYLLNQNNLNKTKRYDPFMDK
jgi:GDP-L-fucose synthase